MIGIIIRISISVPEHSRGPQRALWVSGNGCLSLLCSQPLASLVRQGHHGNAPRTMGSNNRDLSLHCPGGCKSTVMVSAGLAPPLGCEGRICSGTFSIACGRPSSNHVFPMSHHLSHARDSAQTSPFTRTTVIWVKGQSNELF